MSVFIAFAASVIFSVCAIALVLWFSHKKKWYDHINERKIHTGNIPRLGGIGFSFIFIIGAFLIFLIYDGLGDYLQYLSCFIAILISLISGVFDDFRPMSPKYKYLLQLIAALCVIIPGYVFKRLLYYDAGFCGNIGWFGYFVTIVWLTGLTNAFNMLDGVDGLAGGISALIGFFIALITFSISGPSKSVHLYAVFIGVILGFLVFNAPLPKAKIFMGDGGSQFLGFTLAMLPLMKDNHDKGSLPLLYAAPLFAIPILDTTAAVWRRIREGRKIYEPDKAHIHHKLLNLGFSIRGIDAVLYGLQIIVGILVYIAIQYFVVKKDTAVSIIVLCSAYFTALAFFTIIHFLNHAKMKKAALENNAQNANGK